MADEIEKPNKDIMSAIKENTVLRGVFDGSLNNLKDQTAIHLLASKLFKKGYTVDEVMEVLDKSKITEWQKIPVIDIPQKTSMLIAIQMETLDLEKENKNGVNENDTVVSPKISVVSQDMGSDTGSHAGFHIHPNEHSPILYYGSLTGHGKNQDIICEQFMLEIKIVPYFLYVGENENPEWYVYFEHIRKKYHYKVEEVGYRVKTLGIGLTSREMRELTNYLTSLFSDTTPILYDFYGYAVVPSKSDPSKKMIHLIQHEETIFALEGDESPKFDDNEGRKAFLNLLSIASDPQAFLTVACYGLIAPFAPIVKSHRLFFPFLGAVGLPETGKNSLFNLFGSSIWATDSNIKVSQDFKTDWASIANLYGNGVPIIINDIKQEYFDQFVDTLLAASDQTRGGSRGQKSLSLKVAELKRTIMLNANEISVRKQSYDEIDQRFLWIDMQHVATDQEEWNKNKSKLWGMAHSVGKYFDESMQFELNDLLDYFRSSRYVSKNSIIEMGMNALEAWLSPVLNFPISSLLYSYKEPLREGQPELLANWVQYKYAEMVNKYSKYNQDPRDIEANLPPYILKKKEDYIVFPVAYADFLRSNPSFPQTTYALSKKPEFENLVKYGPERVVINGENKLQKLLRICNMQNDGDSVSDLNKTVSAIKPQGGWNDKQIGKLLYEIAVVLGRDASRFEIYKDMKVEGGFWIAEEKNKKDKKFNEPSNNDTKKENENGEKNQ